MVLIEGLAGDCQEGGGFELERFNFDALKDDEMVSAVTHMADCEMCHRGL
jgi:hypothetical protein